MYNNYIFDLYGTLVDIKIDEEQVNLWNKMSMLYSYGGANYTADELKEAYKKLCSNEENALLREDEKSMTEEMIDQRFINYISNSACLNTFEVKAIEDNHVKENDVNKNGYTEIQIENVFRKLYLHKGINISNEGCEYTARFFRALSTKYIRLYDGAKELLEELKKRKKNVYLLSNAQKVFTLNEIKMLGIYDLFDGIFISSDYLYKKPDHRFFNILINKYGLNPSDSIMIGNDPTADIKGAKNVGLDTFYIHSNLSPKMGRGKKVDSTYYMKGNIFSKVMNMTEDNN